MAGVTASASGCSGDQHDKRLFITRATFPGSLGGLIGADGQCGSFATAAGAGGTWKAWLSDTTTNALDRIADVGPWVDMTGRRVFRDKAQLMGFPDIAITTDETGKMWGDYYWTGTLLGGSKSAANCTDWTNGSSGEGTAGAISTDQWTDSGARPCSDSRRIVCFEQ